MFYWFKKRDFDSFVLVTVILILFIFMGSVVWVSFFKEPSRSPQAQEQTQRPARSASNKKISELSSRAEIFSVSGSDSGSNPRFYEKIIIDPFYKVKRGQNQYLSVWVEDKKGIKGVVATVQWTKGNTTEKSLELVEGTKKKGEWVLDWEIPSRNSFATPVLVFEAVSRDGDRETLESYFKLEESENHLGKNLIPFFDVNSALALDIPPPPLEFNSKKGDITIFKSRYIEAGETAGVQGGNIRIINGVSMTLEKNSVFKYNKGKEISIEDGHILKSTSGAEIKNGTVTVCSCNSWSDYFCGGGGCDDNQMHQIRDCETPECSESRCVSDANCGNGGNVGGNDCSSECVECCVWCDSDGNLEGNNKCLDLCEDDRDEC